MELTTATAYWVEQAANRPPGLSKRDVNWGCNVPCAAWPHQATAILIRHEPQPGSPYELVVPYAGSCQNQGAHHADESHPVPTRGVAAGFFARYGSEEQCAAALRAMRWPDGFRCPRCDRPEHYVVGHGARRLFQCQSCRHQTSLTAGTVLDSTKLPLRTWFLAIYLISQDKTGLSSLALMRHLGTSYRTAWLVHHKLMAAMAECDALEPLDIYRGLHFRAI